MNTLESSLVTTNKAVSEVYAFLADLQNHRSLMPPQVTDFEATADTCSYTITGTGSLSQQVQQRVACAQITLVPLGKSPFDYRLHWRLQSHAGGCTVVALLEADMNPIVKAVAARPLQNFLNLMAGQLQKHFEG